MGEHANPAQSICRIFQRHGTSDDEAVKALVAVLMITLKQNDLDKEDALELIGRFWDRVEPDLDLLLGTRQ